MPTPPPPVEYRFKPGESGNPEGKPKGTLALKTVIRNALESEAPEQFIESLKAKGIKIKDNSWDSVLAAVAMAKAASGSVTHLRELWDRRDGKSPQAIKVDGDLNSRVILQFEKIPRKKRKKQDEKTSKDKAEEDSQE